MIYDHFIDALEREYYEIYNRIQKLLISGIPALKPYNVSLPPLNYLPCSTANALQEILIICCWALQGYSALGHCRDILRLDSTGILCAWALQRYFAVGHCKDILRLGTGRIFSD